MSDIELHKLQEEIVRLKGQLENLQASQHFFSSVLSSTPLSIWGVDRGYRLLYMSDRFKARVGLALNIKIEVGTNVLDFHLKESVAEWKKRYDRVFSGEELFVEENFMVNGKLEHLKVKMAPVWAGNKIIGAAIFSIDISEQKNAEENFEKQTERFYHIMGQINDLYYEVDLNGKVIELNAAVSNFSNYEREDLIGQDISKIYANKLDREKLLRTIAHDGRVSNYELLLKDKIGGLKKVLVNATLIRDREGSPVKIVGIIRDVSEMDRMNKELNSFRHIIEHSPVSIVITDVNANITYVNNYFCEITGYRANEVIGKNPRILKSDYYSDQYYIDLWKDLTSGKSWIGEFKNKKKDGTVYWEKAIISPIKDGAGKIINYLAIKEDITELRKVREELLNSEKYYKRLYQNAPIAYMSVDEDGILCNVNKNWQALLGYDHRKVIGTRFQDYVADGFTTHLMNRFNEHLDDNEESALELMLKTKDGDEREVIINCSRFISSRENEQKRQIHCIIFDITERKKSENEIKRLKNFTEKMLTSMREGILVEDESGYLTFVNPIFLKMSGMKAEDILGKYWSDIVPPNVLDETTRRRELWMQGKERLFNSYVEDRQGNLTPVIMNGSQIIEDGKYAGMIVLFVDVSQLKEKEIELRKALDKARISDRLKTSFLANVSHEIRTPMNAILGFSEILHSEKDLPDETREDYFRIINQKGNELLRLISEIVDISKIEAGALTISKGHFKISSLIHSLFRQYKSKLLLEGKEDVELGMDISDEELILYSDEVRINQIFSNLILNALKFTQKGKVNFGYTKGQNELIFHVKDTGPGISKSDQKIIFDMFRQSDDNYTRSYGGTGLGLAICKNLVELLGGSIWVESEKGKGASFFFTIPLDNTSEEINKKRTV